MVDENGIWGIWVMLADSAGGFHIWPKGTKRVKSDKEIEKTKKEIATAKIAHLQFANFYTPPKIMKEQFYSNPPWRSIKILCIFDK